MLSFKQFLGESIIHPKPDDNGNPVRLHSPSTPSPIEHLDDPTKKCTIIPNQELPEHLNNIPFKKWENHPRTPEEWNAVDGQGDFKEPPMKKTTKKLASGVIIHEKYRYCGEPVLKTGGSTEMFTEDVLNLNFLKHFKA